MKGLQFWFLETLEETEVVSPEATEHSGSDVLEIPVFPPGDFAGLVSSCIPAGNCIEDAVLLTEFA